MRPDAGLREAVRNLAPTAASVWTAPAGRLARGHEWVCVVFDPDAGTVRHWAGRSEADALLAAAQGLQ